MFLVLLYQDYNGFCCKIDFWIHPKSAAHNQERCEFVLWGSFQRIVICHQVQSAVSRERFISEPPDVQEPQCGQWRSSNHIAPKVCWCISQCWLVKYWLNYLFKYRKLSEQKRSNTEIESLIVVLAFIRHIQCVCHSITIGQWGSWDWLVRARLD